MSPCLTGRDVGKVPTGFSFFFIYLFFFLWLCCPLVEDVNFVSVLRIVIVSSPFCRVAVKCEAHGSDFLFLLKIPSKMGIFNV